MQSTNIFKPEIFYASLVKLAYYNKNNVISSCTLQQYKLKLD